MYDTPKFSQCKININNSTAGDTLETKLERIMAGEEGAKQGDQAPLIYTERGEGVRAATNIRSDRFEIAIEATDKIQKSYKARREDRAKVELPDKDKNEGETQQLQAK